MKLFWLVLPGLLASELLVAQRFGGNRPSVSWRQVNTPVARVIFPAGLDSPAVRVENIAGRLSQSTLSTIGSRQNKINIVFQPATTVSNAYVSLAPFRSEFYLTPPQNSFDLGSLPWADNLAIHEYRHVQQYNNFNVGLSKAFHVLFGQGGQELANAITIPNWFWEGDAVYQETLVSRQGRGRLPAFFDDYRSLWLAKKNYSWMKLRNGSLRDFTPDHYRLGYMMVAYGREKYGNDFWKKTGRDAAAFRGLFYPFQKAVRKYSGKSYAGFRQDALDWFKNRSLQQPADPPYQGHFLGNQEFPVFTEEGHLIYVNSSYSQVPAFMEKGENREWKLRNRDVSLDNQFSYNNGKIVYTSARPDARWSWNDYNEIQVFDIATRVQKTITRRTKYFSPGISANGKTIVAVFVDPGGGGRLHLLDAETGALIREIPNTGGFFYTYPAFINDNQILTALRTPRGEMALASVSAIDGLAEWLTPPSFRVIGFPLIRRDTVYFSASGDGYDELYACTLKDKKLYRLNLETKGIGAYQPAVSSAKIVFTTFTADGYRLQEADKNTIRWEEIARQDWAKPLPDFGIDFSANKAAGLLSSVPEQQFPVKPYPKSAHLFNFHSLIPYASDPDYTLSIVGNNVLNTMQSELFFSYNRDERYKQFGANTVYGGWFPYVSLGASYIIDRKDYVPNTSKPYYWNEGQLNGGLSIPLNLSKGRSITGLTFGTDYVYKNIAYTGMYKDSFASSSLAYLNSYISFTHQVQKTRQQIYPHFAQSVYINYRDAIQTVKARQFLASGNFYWPGLFPNHSFVLSLAYQHRDTLNQYRYTNSFPFSRGYESPNLRNMYKWGVNYHLSLAYPDWGFAGLVYFLRVRANLFYDHTAGKVAYTNGKRLNTRFRSAGTEIFFDTKWWNELPLSFGFRYSYLLDPDLFGGSGRGRFEFVLPVNLIRR
jgi:hypothetical protein